MQRAAPREEKIKKEEEVKPDENFIFPGAVKRKWYYYFFGFSALV